MDRHTDDERLAALREAAYKAGSHALDRGNELLKADTAALRQQLDKTRRQRPEILGSVNDPDVLKGVTRASATDVYRRMTIHRWRAGDGSIIYLPPDVNHDQVNAAAARIIEQQRSFEALDPNEQAKARANFGSAKGTTNVDPYQDFLQNEALRNRFDQLTKTSPRPK